MYEIFEQLLQSNGISAYKFCKETGVSQSTISTWKKKNSKCGMDLASIVANYFNVTIDYLMNGDVHKQNDSNNELSAKDERDIAKDMENIRQKLMSGADGPLSYDGEPMPEEDAELLLGQIELMMRRLKPINKEKYNPNKNKKQVLHN